MAKEIEDQEKETLLFYLNELIDADPVCEESQRRVWNDKQKSEVKKDQNHMFFEENLPHTDLPEYLQCNISQDLINKPIILETGITYEKSMIELHMQKNGMTDPVTREPQNKGMTMTNKNIQKATQEFILQNAWAYNAVPNDTWENILLE